MEPLDPEIGDPIRVEPHNCSSCGTKLDGVFEVGGNTPPEPGSIMMCWRCGHLMAWDGQRSRELNAEEARYCAGNKTLLQMQEARALAWKNCNRD